MCKDHIVQISSLAMPKRITCHYGTVWVSQAGNTKIFVLSAGDSLKPLPDGRLTIHALESACVAQTQEASSTSDGFARIRPNPALQGS